MKPTKLFFSAWLCSWALTTMAQNTTVDIDVSGIDDGTQVEIALAATQRDEKPIQIATLKDGKAYFAFDSEGPRMYSISTQKPFGRMFVMATKGDHVKVNAVGRLVQGQRSFYDFDPVQVKGTLLQSELEQKLQVRAELNSLYEKYHADNKAFTDKLAGVERGSEQWNQLMASDEGKKFTADERHFFDTVEHRYDELFKANKDSWWGPMLILHIMNYVPEDKIEFYNMLSDEAKQSFYGQRLKELFHPAVAVGNVAPDFVFVDHATGSPTSLKEQLKGKKYLLLDFWASWCGPCRREIPNFRSQYELYKDKGFGIVSISADENEGDWLKALDEEKLPWPNARDAEKTLCPLYQVKFYPTVILMDGNGKIVAMNNDARGQKLQDLLKDLFK